MREIDSGGDLAPGALSVLLRLEADGPSTATRLAAAERIRSQSMGAKIAELERDGLIARRHDPDDGRRLVVELTALGRGRVEDDRAGRREWLARALQERYSDQERERLSEAIAMLDRLLED